MEKSNTEIVIIDDVVKPNDTLLIRLRMFFKNIKLYNNPDEGERYILDNVGKKNMVLILDLDFNSKLVGHQIFDRIRKKTHILPVIIQSATKPNSQELTDFINEQAFAFLKQTTPESDVVETVKRAANSLAARVDAAIESWIEVHPPEKRKHPYVVTANGESFTLEQILSEIRLQTDKGKDLEKRFLMLTIDLVMRNIEHIK